MWDMETGDRRFTLWASSAPPLSELQVRPCPTSPARSGVFASRGPCWALGLCLKFGFLLSKY